MVWLLDTGVGGGPRGFFRADFCFDLPRCFFRPLLPLDDLDFDFFEPDLDFPFFLDLERPRDPDLPDDLPPPLGFFEPLLLLRPFDPPGLLLLPFAPDLAPRLDPPLLRPLALLGLPDVAPPGEAPFLALLVPARRALLVPDFVGFGILLLKTFLDFDRLGFLPRRPRDMGLGPLDFVRKLARL